MLDYNLSDYFDNYEFFICKSNSLNDLNRKEKITFNSYVLSWLINGELDRVAYFVTKNNKQIKQLEESKNLKVVKDYGGYKIYKRELK